MQIIGGWARYRAPPTARKSVQRFKTHPENIASLRNVCSKPPEYDAGQWRGERWIVVVNAPQVILPSRTLDRGLRALRTEAGVGHADFLYFLLGHRLISQLFSQLSDRSFERSDFLLLCDMTC
jgi:hypothetical protein